MLEKIKIKAVLLSFKLKDQIKGIKGTMYHGFLKNISSTAVFNCYNNKKCKLSCKLAYLNDF